MATWSDLLHNCYPSVCALYCATYLEFSDLYIVVVLNYVLTIDNLFVLSWYRWHVCGLTVWPMVILSKPFVILSLCQLSLCTASQMCFLSQCNVNILRLHFKCYKMCVISKHFCHSRSSKCFTQWPQMPLFTHTRDALEPDSSGFTFLCGGNASELVPCDCLYWIPLNQCLDKVVSQRGRQTWELFFNPLCQPHEDHPSVAFEEEKEEG